jgi:apolipoprotein D and lipocalin family protein
MKESFCILFNFFSDYIIYDILGGMMQIHSIILGLFVLLSLSLAAEPVSTVKSVDLNKYLGTWYQIAYFPTKFQPNTGGMVTADYSLDKKGKIRVVNTSYRDDEGKEIWKQAKAKAWSVDKSNSKLKVRFFWPLTGDYWIVKLDEENYSYSVVSDPKRKYLWILNREQSMDQKVYRDIIEYLRTGGWDMDKLVLTGKLN